MASPTSSVAPQTPTTPKTPNYMKGTFASSGEPGQRTRRTQQLARENMQRVAEARFRSRSLPSSLNKNRVQASKARTPKTAKVAKVFSPGPSTPGAKVAPRRNTQKGEEEKKTSEGKIRKTPPPIHTSRQKTAAGEEKTPGSGRAKDRGPRTPGAKVTPRRDAQKPPGEKVRKKPKPIDTQKTSVRGRARDRVQASRIQSRSLTNKPGGAQRFAGTPVGRSRLRNKKSSAQSPKTASTPTLKLQRNEGEPISGNFRSALKRHVKEYGLITAPETPGVIRARKVSFHALYSEETPKKSEGEKESPPASSSKILEAEAVAGSRPLEQQEVRPLVEEEVQQPKPITEAVAEPRPLEQPPEPASEAKSLIEEEVQQPKPEAEAVVEPQSLEPPSEARLSSRREVPQPKPVKPSKAIKSLEETIARLSSKKPKPAPTPEIQRQPQFVSGADLREIFRTRSLELLQGGVHVSLPTLDEDEKEPFSVEEEDEPLPIHPPHAAEEDDESLEDKPLPIDFLNFSAFNLLLRAISVPLKGELTPSEINTNPKLLGKEKNSTVDLMISHKELQSPFVTINGELRDLDHINPKDLEEYTTFTFPCFTISSPELHILAAKCPFLKEATFFMCRELTGYGLQALHDKKLSQFRLFDCPQVDNESLIALLESCSDFLEEVAIIGRPISSSLLTAFGRCKKLKTLDLSHCIFPEDVDLKPLHRKKSLKNFNITRAENLNEGSKSRENLGTLQRKNTNLVVTGMGTLDEVHSGKSSAIIHAASMIAPTDILELSEEEAERKYLKEVKDEAQVVLRELLRGEAPKRFHEKFDDKKYVKEIHEKAEKIRQQKAEQKGRQYVIREADLSDRSNFLKNLLQTFWIEPEKTGLFDPMYPAGEEEVEAWIQAASDLFKLLCKIREEYSFMDRAVPNVLALGGKLQLRVPRFNFAKLGLLRAPRLLRTRIFSRLTRIDLQDNQLTSFPTEMIEKLCQIPREELLVVDLRKNPFREIPSDVIKFVHRVRDEKELPSIERKLKESKSPRWSWKGEKSTKTVAVLY